jgi:purine-binding chemotaxis protein CheW
VIALAFDVAGGRYAAPIGPIEEVLPHLPVEPLPGAPAHVRGVVFVRGHVLPVVDAAERLGLRRAASTPAPAEPPIIVFRAFRVAGRLAGLVVDDVADLVEIDDAAVAPAGEIGLAASGADALIRGVVDVGGILHRVVDPERLLA